MANQSALLILFAVVFGVIHIASGYSFASCIEDPSSKGLEFICVDAGRNISAIVNDLPQTTLNLTIIKNELCLIPNNSFINLTNLQNLRLDNNKVNSIEASAFKNLWQLKLLNLSYNNLKNLSRNVFEDLHNLNHLLLYNNKLTQLHEDVFSNLPKLEILSLRQNHLNTFLGIVESVTHLQSLRCLDLCSNMLTSLNHSNSSLPKSLTSLCVCENKLVTLGCKSSFLTGIKKLDLSHNSKLPTKAFQGIDLGQLQYLRLRSTSVNIASFLNMTNINASSIDFSGTRLRNDSLLNELCVHLSKKVKQIETLSLVDNEIQNLSIALDNCPQITKTLNLSHNELHDTNCLDFLSKHTKIKTFNIEHNHLTALPSCAQSVFRFPSLKVLSYRYNRILYVNDKAFYHTPNIDNLQLNINTIAFLHRKALKGLKMLTTLRLDNNLLTDLFNDTFEDQISLKTLNLRNNRISVIFNRTFSSLKFLNILDLGGNKITHFEPLGFQGLNHLSKLYLDGNNLRTIDTSLYFFQDTLNVLDLQGNQIRFLSETAISPFLNLSKLTDLKLDGQLPHGLTTVPSKFFHGLHSLEYLYLTNNQITNLAADAFDDLTSLNFLKLDNCCVGVIKLQPGIFKNLGNLTQLMAENTGIQNFSKEVFGNLTKLKRLNLNYNVMQSIEVDALESLPNLSYLDIQDIPLSCTCRNGLLQNWTLHNKNVQVVHLYLLTCQNSAKHFHNFDTKVCYMDLGKYLFFSTTTMVFIFTVIPLLNVKLYWKMKYGYYVFRSWFSEQWHKLREEGENCKYDAFISYNSSDEEWVMQELLPNLEGNGSSFKICLHHRDFELGRYIVDNIVSAVYNSRKTICVVSQNFLQSEWCSLEIQLASYRLFDEHRDVLLLVFLEYISERQLSSYHQMRKVLLKKTYLQWPGPDCTDSTQAQELFWNRLHRAMRKESKCETEEKD